MKGFSTRNWIIGILIGAWIASFVVGYLHMAKIITEPENPIVHTFIDWAYVVIFLLPISYMLARIIPGK
ncbi:MAG: hypothetical protein HYW05_02950 [Candidatus Diapherotrites archaeon]|nr:hypothetical protein [Candidatus Diapherotrites archaeon]